MYALVYLRMNVGQDDRMLISEGALRLLQQCFYRLNDIILIYHSPQPLCGASCPSGMTGTGLVLGWLNTS
eukprot:47393-Eustigmatos_ZCMA.PRE.1